MLRRHIPANLGFMRAPLDIAAAPLPGENNGMAPIADALAHARQALANAHYARDRLRAEPGPSTRLATVALSAAVVQLELAVGELVAKVNSPVTTHP